MSPADRLHGLLLGTAVGDSVGLPAEGLSPTSITRRGWDQHWQQRLLFGLGMWSDDTEHTLILAQALNHANGDVRRFEALLSRGLKHWLLLLPAGVGLATARSLLKLWFGFSARKSGVLSAGNGPMMRAALLGVVFHDDMEKRSIYNRCQTSITHTDPKAEFCSRAIVELAALFSSSAPNLSLDGIIRQITFADADSNYRALVEAIHHSLSQSQTLSELMQSLGANPRKGISGYCYHTLAAVLYCGHTNGWHALKALPAIWSAGGDTDTTGAILGALCGTLHGPRSFPPQWARHIQEFPTTVDQFHALATATIAEQPYTIRPSLHPLLLVRNLLFLITVLSHGLARLFRY